MRTRVWSGILLPLCLALAEQAVAAPIQAEQGDFVLHDFRFTTGEVLPELNLHYTTVGTPLRDGSGRVRNAVLLLHGTGGRAASLLRPEWADALYGPGQPLDVSRYYLILPDSVGHGGSTKPSDRLHARFPRYTYDDMVRAQHLLLTQGLGVDHLRLIVGISMGGMHAWMWAATYPEFADAVLPMACLPVQIAGRNRMERRAITDAIRNDPEWRGGEYVRQPSGLTIALQIAFMTGSGARELYLAAPTVAAADRLLDDTVRSSLATTDANDFLYAWESSRTYDPGPGLERIRATVTAINSADDERYPPELGVMEREIRRVPRGRYVLIPISDASRGHRTFYRVELWKQFLVELLAVSERQ